MDCVLNRLSPSLVLASAICMLVEPALAASSADHGKELFQAKCNLCHTSNQGGPNKLGPNLFGVVGRHSASLPGFNYSSAMKNANLTWTPATLASYLAGPQKSVPGTRMTFTGFDNPSDAQDVVAYLATQK